MGGVDFYIFWMFEIFFYFDFGFNWFMGFRHPETLELIWSLEEIAQRYVKGWFFIDFMSIFPFQIFVDPDKGSAVKLLRMPRMLRLGKLLDEKNIKRLMKALGGDAITADDIVKLFDCIFMYKLFRLLLVLILLTYF